MTESWSFNLRNENRDDFNQKQVFFKLSKEYGIAGIDTNWYAGQC